MFLRHNYLGILWAILILLLSALPPKQFPSTTTFENFDKAVHVFLYAQFVLLLIIGFIKQNRFRRLRDRAISFAFLISFFYGMVIELLQKFIFEGRSIEFLDLIANVSGTIFGILVFFLIYGKSRD